MTNVEYFAIDPGRLQLVLSQPGVAWLHVRSAVAQCFTFGSARFKGAGTGLRGGRRR